MPSPMAPTAKDDLSFHSSCFVKVPPRRQQGLFAPSECGDSTEADSSDSDGGEGQPEGQCPLAVEASADSIGSFFETQFL